MAEVVETVLVRAWQGAMVIILSSMAVREVLDRLPLRPEATEAMSVSRAVLEVRAPVQAPPIQVERLISKWDPRVQVALDPYSLRISRLGPIPMLR